MDPSPAATTKQQQFPCKQCGANLQFDRGKDCLRCPYCGATNEVPKSPDTIQELDYLTYVHQLPEGAGVHDTITIKCTTCAAETTLPPNVTASLCPFCGSGIVATASTKKA